MPAIFARLTKSNDLITIADFPGKADGRSILMVNGALKAKPVELWQFGEASGNRRTHTSVVHANAKPLARFSRTGQWKPA
jgi:hypothetical protein